MMLGMLMNHYHPKTANELLKFLPQEDRRKIMAQEIHSTDLTPLIQQHQTFLENIHYSWIKPLLDIFPDRLRPVIFSLLTPEQLAGWRVSKPEPVSEPVKAFMLNQMYTLLEVEEHLPLEYLPETELSPLGKWTKSQLIHLMDFLSLYDLASEVRHIVNRNYLKNIYQCLTSKELRYLKICLHQREHVVAPKLGIDPSKQDCAKLKQTLHRRGLLRLGLALNGQHPDLIWHLTHTLDVGRGKILLKNYKPSALPQVTSLVKQQVLHVMNFLKSE